MARAELKKIKYIEVVGRRKSSVARIRISKDKPNLTINGKTLEQYFPSIFYQDKILTPLKKISAENKFSISIQVRGGGMTGQAEAIRLGISRGLVEIDKNNKPLLRKSGLLTRDSRVVERKKYGLKKARRAPQWQKR